MKTILLSVLLLLSLCAQGQTLRGPVTTEAFTRDWLTVKSAADARSKLGVSISGQGTNDAAYGITTLEHVVATNYEGNAINLTNVPAIITGGSATALVQGISGGTNFVPLGAWGFAVSAGNPNTNRWRTPYAVVFTNWYGVNETGIGPGTNHTCWLFTNGLSTGFKMSYQGTGTTTPFSFSNTTSSVYVPAGVSVMVGISNNCASVPAAQVESWSIEALVSK